MKTIVSLIALLFSTTVYGQTKLISFRSHSGNNANFRTAVENNLFDIGRSNFGIVVQIKTIDTVMRVSNDKIIIVRKDAAGRLNDTHFYKETLTSTNAPDFFKATSLDSLKQAIQKRYKYVNLDSTYFVGFEKKFKAGKK